MGPDTAGCMQQDEFGVEQDDVYEIVAAWHDHAADVEEYVAVQEEFGLDAKGIRDALEQHQRHKKDLDEYEALRRDLGMDAEGMRKVRSPFFELCLVFLLWPHLQAC